MANGGSALPLGVGGGFQGREPVPACVELLPRWLALSTGACVRGLISQPILVEARANGSSEACDR